MPTPTTTHFFRPMTAGRCICGVCGLMPFVGERWVPPCAPYEVRPPGQLINLANPDASA